MSAPFLEVKDWRTHQHYGKRRPPWIKLYTRLLDDPSFLALAENVQAQLVKVWILAASMGHPLPNDSRLIAGKIGAKKLHLDALIASGFLIPCYQNASNVLAKSEQNARPLSTENREQRERTEKTTTPAAAKKPPRADGGNWLLPASRVWEARFGAGSFDFGKTGKHLKRLKTHHPPAEIAEHLKRYLDKTDAQYVSVPRFVDTFGQYASIDPNALVDEYGCLTPLGEKETRPAGLRVA